MGEPRATRHLAQEAPVQFDGSLGVARQAIFDERNAVVIKATWIIPAEQCRAMAPPIVFHRKHQMAPIFVARHDCAADIRFMQALHDE